MSKSALVFGASGVTGWAFINEILNDYPKQNTWKRAHALTNRPLSQEQSQWPKDPRLNIVSGIDLLANTQESLEDELKENIPNIGEVTHMYYLAYKAGTNVQKELEEAVDMWKKTLIAVDNLCPNLEFVVLQTGAKMCTLHPIAIVSSHVTNSRHRWLPSPCHRTLLLSALHRRTPQRIAATHQRRLRRHAFLSSPIRLHRPFIQEQKMELVRHTP